MSSTSPSSPPVWFITGAASGFGKHIALHALSRGHIVIASARSPSRLSSLSSAGALTASLDVTSPLTKIQALAASLHAQYGQITHLVNAAGYFLIGAVEETSPEEDARIFQTNVLGTLNVCKAFLPYLRASPGHRTIANFGSIASWTCGPGWCLYAGTKWAISGISEGMRAELAPLGISVTVVEPGYFYTGFLDQGRKVVAEKELECYADTAGKTRMHLEEVHGKQVGDVDKGSKVVVGILLREGGQEVPVRIPLGSDAVGVIGGKCMDTLGLLGDWEGVVRGTDREV